jgi:hypothetical protein
VIVELGEDCCRKRPELERFEGLALRVSLKTKAKTPSTITD